MVSTNHASSNRPQMASSKRVKSKMNPSASGRKFRLQYPKHRTVLPHVRSCFRSVNLGGCRFDKLIFFLLNYFVCLFVLFGVHCSVEFNHPKLLSLWKICRICIALCMTFTVTTCSHSEHNSRYDDNLMFLLLIQQSSA